MTFGGKGPNREVFGNDRTIRHDDVIVVPNFFCDEEDWTIYYDLIKELRECQSEGFLHAYFSVYM